MRKMIYAVATLMLCLATVATQGQCQSWCVNTGNAQITQSPSCYGEPYQITITGEYSSNSLGYGNGTFNASPGSSMSITFSSYCYSCSPDYYCCGADGQGNCTDYSCYTCNCTSWNNEHTVNITVPEEPCYILGTAVANPPSSNGCSDGQIIFNAITNACSGYHVNINGSYYEGGSFPVSISTFSAGTYLVQFHTDPGGCDDETYVTVPAGPCTLQSDIITQAASSATCSDGSISVEVNGACQYYRDIYLLRNATTLFHQTITPDQTALFNGLFGGGYTVRVIAGDCDFEYPATVEAPPCAFPYLVSSANATAGGSCGDGSITLVNTMDCFGYAWLEREDGTILGSSWDGTWMGPHIMANNLSPATYVVKSHRTAQYPYMPDYVTCETQATVVIGPPCQLEVEIASTAAVSMACDDGAISVIATTGGCSSYEATLYFLDDLNVEHPYQYSGSPLDGDTTLFSGLPAGTYVVETKRQPYVMGACERRDTVEVGTPGCVFPFEVETLQGTAEGNCQDGRIVLSPNTGCSWNFTVMRADSAVVFGPTDSFWWWGTDIDIGPLSAGIYLIRATGASYLPYSGDIVQCETWSTVQVTCGTNTSAVAARTFFEGSYVSGLGLMSDALRSLAAFPQTEPYTALGYTHTGGGGETTNASVLSVAGDDAIVDWVVLELRSSSTPNTVVESRSALLQRDGDVVATDGVSTVNFSVPPGNYHVAVRHRNHLGVMTLNPVALGPVATAVDFTSASTATWGTNARKTVGSAQVLWSGDVTFNHALKYTGTGNDRDPILVKVGSTTPNNTVSGYWKEDVNMNGQVKYTGSGNDRDPILVNVGSTTPNNVRVEQLP